MHKKISRLKIKKEKMIYLAALVILAVVIIIATALSLGVPQKIFSPVIPKSVSYEVKIPDSWKSAGIPADIISPETAVAQAKTIPGYNNEPITSVEAVYSPEVDQWFWGVRTSRGVITLKAGQKK